MIIRSGTTDILPPEAAAPPRGIPNRARERARVVKRLKVIVATHVEASSRIGFPLGMPDLLAVIATLRAEADGLSPAAHLTSGEEVSTHLRQGLFEELLGEPSNIFFTSKVSEEVIRYEALPKDFWRECLEVLSAELATLKTRHS